jgi:hypothetical protein
VIQHIHVFGLRLLILAALAVVPAKAQEPGRYISETFMDFGSVPQGHVVSHRFVLRNREEGPLKIRIVALSLPGMRVKLPQELAPSAEGAVTVTWDTRAVQGETTGEVILRFNDTESITLTLRARVQPPVDVLPYPVLFISTFHNERVHRTLEIVNNSAQAFQIKTIDGFEHPLEVTYTTLESGRRWELGVDFESDTVARIDKVVQIHTDHPQHSVIKIPVHILVKPDVWVNPESVDFGRIIGKSTMAEIFLLKKRQGPIRILAVRTDISGLNVSYTSSTAGDAHQFSVQFPNAGLPKGPVAGNLYIVTDDPVFSEVRVPIQAQIE